jgi:hypothetical protein
MSFEAALARNPAPPRKLGDVQLSYDPPLLVGKGAARATLAPTAALLAGTGFGISTLAAFLVHASEVLLTALVLATGGAFIANVVLERRAVRRRSFVVHFAEKVLRLDTATALNAPRTTVVNFEKISAVEIVTALDGLLALTVTFIPLGGRPVVTKEALVAFVLPAQRAELERLAGMLRNAFAASPKLEAQEEPVAPPRPGEPPEPVDTFGPG